MSDNRKLFSDLLNAAFAHRLAEKNPQIQTEKERTTKSNSIRLDIVNGDESSSIRLALLLLFNLHNLKVEKKIGAHA